MLQDVNLALHLQNILVQLRLSLFVRCLSFEELVEKRLCSSGRDAFTLEGNGDRVIGDVLLNLENCLTLLFKRLPPSCKDANRHGRAICGRDRWNAANGADDVEEIRVA
jgi:hypothetical protein